MPRVKKRTHAQNSTILQKVARRLELAIGDLSNVALNSDLFEDVIVVDKVKSSVADIRNELIKLVERVDLYKL